MIPWRERATRLVIAAFATLFVITGWSFSPAVAATQSSRLTAELATYAYDAPFAVTTPGVHPRIAAQLARPTLRTAPRLSTSSRSLRRAAKAGRGGAGPVRLGQAGEDAVRGAYDIGPKVPIRVGGRDRIPDGLTTSTLSEVKNVASLSYSRQLRDYVSYAQQTGRQVDLYVRGGASPTRLSGPLRDTLRDPSVPINLRFIP